MTQPTTVPAAAIDANWTLTAHYNVRRPLLAASAWRDSDHRAEIVEATREIRYQMMAAELLGCRVIGNDPGQGDALIMETMSGLRIVDQGVQATLYWGPGMRHLLAREDGGPAEALDAPSGQLPIRFRRPRHHLIEAAIRLLFRLAWIKQANLNVPEGMPLTPEMHASIRHFRHRMTCMLQPMRPAVAGKPDNSRNLNLLPLLAQKRESGLRERILRPFLAFEQAQPAWRMLNEYKITDSTITPGDLPDLAAALAILFPDRLSPRDAHEMIAHGYKPSTNSVSQDWRYPYHESPEIVSAPRAEEVRTDEAARQDQTYADVPF
jgi:hypothetical protein